MLSGKAFTSSTKVLSLSGPEALSRRRALNSVRSSVNSPVTSITAAWSLPQALIGNSSMIGASEVARTEFLTESSWSPRMRS